MNEFESKSKSFTEPKRDIDSKSKITSLEVFWNHFTFWKKIKIKIIPALTVKVKQAAD